MVSFETKELIKMTLLNQTKTGLRPKNDKITHMTHFKQFQSNSLLKKLFNYYVFYNK